MNIPPNCWPNFCGLVVSSEREITETAPRITASLHCRILPDIRHKSSKKFSAEKVAASEKGVFWKRGLSREAHVLDILENFAIPENLENPQIVENKGESEYF